MNTEFKVLNKLLIHISKVKKNLAEIKSEIGQRSIIHDLTKFTPIEFDGFVKTEPKFKKADFGTPEYQDCINEIGQVIKHHHEHNRHHVQFHENGFQDMNLIDILEMLADWKAASDRNSKLSFKDSLPIAYEKYKIPENMQKHIESTLTYLGWL